MRARLAVSFSDKKSPPLLSIMMIKLKVIPFITPTIDVNLQINQSVSSTQEIYSHWPNVYI